MHTQLLELIDQITSERDKDSLEIRLVEGLAKLFELQKLSLVRLADESRIDSAEVMVEAINKTGDNSTFDPVVNDPPFEAIVDSFLEASFESRKVQSHRITNTGHTRMLVPIVYDDRVGCVLCLEYQGDRFEGLPLLESIMKIVTNYLRLLDESEKDKLTGLFNRKTFDAKLSRMLELQRRRKIEMAKKKGPAERRRIDVDANAWLAIMDIDFFKRVNDTYGHVYGDEVILMLSQMMQRIFRNTDLFFRFGGEEFVIVLEPMPREFANKALNRYREVVANYLFPQIGQVTVSMGFAGISQSDYPPGIIDRADKALYYSKEHGRNCVSSYEQLVAEDVLIEEDRSGPIDLF